MEITAIDGVVVVNKPGNWTSHDVVAKMRGIAGTKRVGHLGTLDPLATGVLPVMIGNVTRLAQFWEKSEKVYDAAVRFGYATDTYDCEGELSGAKTEVTVTADMLEPLLATMRGPIEQVPPPVSAKKINGVPAYKLARKNIAVELKPVPVEIYELTLVSVEGSLARLHVRCSAGTYIRSIAHELGRLLGCGGHIEELVRAKSGPFHIGQAKTLEELQNGGLQDALVPADELLPQFPSVYVDELTVRHIRQGRDFHVSPFRIGTSVGHVKAVNPEGKVVAIGKIVLPHVYHPMVVL